MVEGLCGVNCRHSFGAGDGEHNPYEHFDSEENKIAYMRSQQQRAKERRICKLKRECAAYNNALKNDIPDDVKADIEKKFSRKAQSLVKAQKDYREFCKTYKLRPLEERLKVAEYGYEDAKAVGKAVKEYANSMKQSNDAVEIPPKYDGNFDGFDELIISKEEKTQLLNLKTLSQKNGAEYAAIKNNGEWGEAFTSGIYDKVNIPFPDNGKNLELIHSHTELLPLSKNDFAQLCRPDVDKIGVICYNNDVYIAEVGNGYKPDYEEFKSACIEEKTTRCKTFVI